jgi:hypothetical protein
MRSILVRSFICQVLLQNVKVEMMITLVRVVESNENILTTSDHLDMVYIYTCPHWAECMAVPWPHQVIGGDQKSDLANSFLA